VFAFYKSEATVHQSGHPNAEALRQDFFTTSIGRWKRELDSQSVAQVQSLCREGLASHDYT
ncbi:unnamed protein product, partial [marine sediment metagenome]